MLVTIFDSNGSAVIDSIGAQLISYKDSTRNSGTAAPRF